MTDLSRSVWVPLGAGLLLEIQAPQPLREDSELTRYAAWRITVKDGLRDVSVGIPEDTEHALGQEVFKLAVQEAVIKAVRDLVDGRLEAIHAAVDEARVRASQR